MKSNHHIVILEREWTEAVVWDYRSPLPTEKNKLMEVKKAINELHDLRDQIESLANKFAKIVDNEFPFWNDYIETHGLLQLTDSTCPYDLSLNTFLTELCKQHGIKVWDNKNGWMDSL